MQRGHAYAVPSLSATLLNLLPLGNLDVNRGILADTPIDPTNVAPAKAVVKGLQAVQDLPLNPGVTEQMINSTNLRMLAVEGAHMSLYTPILDSLLNHFFQMLLLSMHGLAEVLRHLTAIEADGKFARATTLNSRLISQNA
ncbi:uncharacterized protein LACBIDRAFT_322473 [Laccaria bicolor S238N-H82]|uniref:Predicted protein n=1 Tax=Laccaria bicolor (strain S238N-H82 / ATCC MYA-4686) TaxID=486041 RepID=B0CWF1_LACBS|nr:uncharacterized protein LACBIDRAFT_322473 [Laccaria bicolor S238N-H82]EDR13500.1 predicted protein [Laccaria bicolor S238N-H82]|eukprot:XP_001875998.1 predicted protein [Laccaria bicolor S238N-H82]